MKEAPTKKCHFHEEPLIVFCFDCDTLICHHCTAKLHRDHNFEFSKIASPETKRNLLEELPPLRKATVNLSNAIEAIHITKQEIEAQGNSLANSIQASFNELLQVVEKQRKKVLFETECTIQGKIDNLSGQEKNLSLVNAEVQSIIDYTEQCASHCSDNEVMSMHSELRTGILKKIEELSMSGQSMEPVEEADIGYEVKCADALQQLSQTSAKITRLGIDPTLCTVKGEGTKMAEVHQISVAVLTVKLTNNIKTARSAIVEGQLKSLYNGAVVRCDVNQLGRGEYHIQYTPIIRGRHELIVSVDGQQVSGSPFPVFVSIPPTQLGKPVEVWRDINKARYITMNSVGDIIVTGTDGVYKLEKEGRKHILVTCSASGLSRIRAVSTDDEDNIYCTDRDTNKVMKCNKTGSNVQVYKVRQVNGPGHYGVTVVRDEVFLSERGNSGTVMIYDRELNFVRHIKIMHMGSFHSVSTDNSSNLYATDITSSYIRVFNYDGVLLRSFSSDDRGVRRLNLPNSLCVSGLYVYVSNWRGHYVSVFSTTGEYLTSFGQYGFKEGYFNGPHGVCADRDGFIFVTDLANDRIQYF